MKSLSSFVLACVFQSLPAQAKEAILFDGKEVASIIHQDHRTAELGPFVGT
ncbi:hypothetical protein [Pseudoxanthomonas sp. UTMC 1351]|uniref:hypothetical protein n=1 Tax=Pseudoxanthomonas sp. UTMC 1351 TaxID=2695853 RepID=UPI0034CD2760